VQPGYRLVKEPPSVSDYLRLRRDAGLLPVTEEQATADPPGRGLYARHGFVETAPHSVGMALRL
jgi:hypothetical protein